MRTPTPPDCRRLSMSWNSGELPTQLEIGALWAELAIAQADLIEDQAGSEDDLGIPTGLQNEKKISSGRIGMTRLRMNLLPVSGV